MNKSHLFWAGLMLLSPILLLSAPVLIGVYWPSRRAFRGFAALAVVLAVAIGLFAVMEQWQG